MTNLEKIIFSKEWSMFFNIPKIKIIDNLRIQEWSVPDTTVYQQVNDHFLEWYIKEYRLFFS